MRFRIQQWFVISAGVILAAVGGAKWWSATGEARVLKEAAPLLGIAWRDAMILVGGLEIALSLFCLISYRRRSAMLLVQWISLNFVLYQAGLWWIGWETCECLGQITSALRLSDQTAGIVVKLMLAWLLLGSWGLWLWGRLGQVAVPRARENESSRCI
mgnify:CR=1 FL=1